MEPKVKRPPLTLSFTTPLDKSISEEALLDVVKETYKPELNGGETSAIALLSSNWFWQPGAKVSIVDLEYVSGTVTERPIPGREHLPPKDRIDTGEDDNLALKESIKNLDPDTTTLILAQAFPTGQDWDILANKFPNITKLIYVSGFDEILQDGGFPEQWKLDAVVIVDAGGSDLMIPQVVRGEVGVLVLDYCSCLIFDSDLPQDTDGKTSQSVAASVAAPASPPQMHTLAIWENDSWNMLLRFEKAYPHLIRNLTTLNIHHTSGGSFDYEEEDKVPALLASLASIKSLHLTLDHVDDLDAYKDVLSAVPSQVEELHFHGPDSLYQEGMLQDWIDGLASGAILPKLQRLNFVCGLEMSTRQPGSVDMLEQKVWQAARNRGIELVKVKTPNPTFYVDDEKDESV